MKRILNIVFATCLSIATFSIGAAQIPQGVFIQKIEFRDTDVSEALRLISELTGANVIATSQAGDRKLTMILRNTSVRGAMSSIARVTGLSFTYDRESNAYLLLTPEQFSDDVVVIRDGQTRIFTLRNQNVVTAALTIEKLFGDRVALDLDTDDPDALIIDETDIQASRETGFRSDSDSDRVLITGGNRNRRADSIQDIDRNDLSARELARLLGLQIDNSIGFGDAAEVLGLEPTIYVTINREHNLLFVRTADDAVLKSIEQIIRASDRPSKQVLLEMKILALTLDDEFRSLFNFGLSDDSGDSFLNLGNFPLEGGTFFLQLLNDNLLAQIELLESQGRIETLSTPLLVASNNSPAELFVGEEAV
ncbi:MAG: hypothetical protein AAGD47_00445, partial [Pseudomonadota bacterium]